MKWTFIKIQSDTVWERRTSLFTELETQEVGIYKDSVTQRHYYQLISGIRVWNTVGELGFYQSARDMNRVIFRVRDMWSGNKTEGNRTDFLLWPGYLQTAYSRTFVSNNFVQVQFILVHIAWCFISCHQCCNQLCSHFVCL